MREKRSIQQTRGIARAALLAMLCIGAAAGCDKEQPPKRELHSNVVLIVIDSLRADHVSSYGYGLPISPALDRLSVEGARFETALAPSSSALPSLVSIHTALPPEQHGVVSGEFALGDEALTLAEVLAEAGFATAAFVAGPGFSKARGLSQGFESYVEELEPGDGAQATRVVSNALTWLASWHESKSPAPYFLYVQLPLLDYRSANDQNNSSSELAKYWASIRSADREVGRLLEQLDTLGLSRDTLLIVTSSRGHEFGTDAMKGVGHSLRNESVRVPLLVRFPSQIDAGKAIPERARLMDIGSTILMLTRVWLPADFGFTHEAPGFSMRDLAEMLVGEPRDFEVAVMGDLAGRSQSYRHDPYKLVRYLPDTDSQQPEGEYVLFNLDNDPDESQDIFEQEARRSKMLVRKLEAWREICAKRPSYAVPYREEVP